MARPRLLYLFRDSGHHYKELDYRTLSSYFDVIRLPYRYDGQSLHRLASAIKQVDAVYAWFASPFAAAAVWLARRNSIPSVIVAGGFDVADYPPLQHGARYRPLQKHFIKFALEASDLVLPVSYFNQDELLRFASPKKYQMIYNGVDVDFCTEIPAQHSRPRRAITVGTVDPHSSRIKGHFHFAEIAKRLAGQAEFLLIGPIKHGPTMRELKRISGGHIQFMGALEHAQVIEAFRQSRVYLQLSHYESFGLTVPEAMACGCIPIVSRRGALPEIVDHCGSIHEPDAYPLIASSVLATLAQPCCELKSLQERASVFSAAKREQALMEAIVPLIRQ